MSVQLSRELIAGIRDHGTHQYPHECCGFLLGTADRERKSVRRLLAAENARQDAARRNRFLITPDDYQAAERLAREAGLEVLGFYHSHPDAPARPSQYDLDHAWPWYSYVIVAMTRSGAAEMTSWVLEDDRSCFTPEPIETAGSENGAADVGRQPSPAELLGGRLDLGEGPKLASSREDATGGNPWP